MDEFIGNQGHKYEPWTPQTRLYFADTAMKQGADNVDTVWQAELCTTDAVYEAVLSAIGIFNVLYYLLDSCWL